MFSMADFNPRPLAGATQRPGWHCINVAFQSTPPCGGDDFWLPDAYDNRISIHAPLRGRQQKLVDAGKAETFQSTPPCGGDLDER